MDSYEIIMTPDATADLVELRDYIADVLLVPGTALSYIRTIREEISKLAEMPGRINSIFSSSFNAAGTVM